MSKKPKKPKRNTKSVDFGVKPDDWQLTADIVAAAADRDVTVSRYIKRAVITQLAADRAAARRRKPRRGP